ncbi:MAG: type IX secretion system outer membrane channel protein PorV [Cyanothece sp. SIO1E1]|nr:type IX secretion system outer membrane channel protein PorV [Cyanothece sp. SIO1E1]
MNCLLLRTTCLVVLALNLFPHSLQSQCLESDGRLYGIDGTSCTNNIVSAVPFLRIVADARSSALGDAGIAISVDANAIHFNASKLAYTKGEMAIAANYTSWLPGFGARGIYLASLNGYKRIDEKQTLGFGFRYFTLGDLRLDNFRGMPLNTGTTREFSGSIAYARTIAKQLSVGITAKLIYSNLVADLPTPARSPMPADLAGAVDISATYETPFDLIPWQSDLRVGLVLSNLGSKMYYTDDSINKDYLPANFGLGAAWEIQFDKYNSLTLTAELNKLMVPTPCPSTASLSCDLNGNGRPDFKEQSPLEGAFNSFSDSPEGFNEEMREILYSIGIEYWYKLQFALRGGYYTEHSTKGGRRFFTAGIGYRYEIVEFNFSYLLPAIHLRNPIDRTWRVSLLFDFPEKELHP